MNLLYRLVYATHANGTHHKLAMDALRYLKCDNSEAWRRLILKYSELYLEGSKAPDKEFKDFTNHVLHVRDNFWGGAPKKAENWYAHLTTALKEEQWQEAVYAAGVLSHYYTDPIEPLHTAQSEAENNIHRAVEWSISKSYRELRKIGDTEFADLQVEAGQGTGWLGDMVREGATCSNAYYEKLITHYDIHKGAVHPTEGLDENSRRFTAMLLRYAALGFGAILDRAFTESGATPPKVALTPQTFMAGLKIPVRWVTAKLEDAEDRKQVQAMYDELQSTGTVEKTLGEDEKTVRTAYTREVLGRTAPAPASKPAQPKTESAAGRKMSDQSPAVATAVPSHAEERLDDDKIKQQADNALRRIEEETESSSPPSETSAPATAAADAVQSEPFEDAPAAPSADDFYLKPLDKVVDAPSIGKKTAKKLNQAGIFRVSDLLGADPDELADLINVHYIDAETIIDWQDQARLCCQIPRLRGRHAQLLVGSGYRDSSQIAEADPRDIHPDIQAFCETEEGSRINRSDEAPSLTEIGDWIAMATSAKLEDAA